MRRKIFLFIHIFFIFITLFYVSDTRGGLPSLEQILAASEYLSEGDIPRDGSTESGKTPLYVATDGDDNNSGLSIDSPKAHLGAAIEYANQQPSTPFVIYLRDGTYYRPSQYEYLEIERGDLMITAYPGEEVLIRPDFWPGNPTSWGEEVFLFSFGPHDNITISELEIQGWGVPFIFGSQFSEPAMKNLVIKKIRAGEFRKRDSASISEFFSTDYVSEGYFDGPDDFDPDDPGIKYQIENLILSRLYIEGVDMPINIGDEDDANVKGLRISEVEVRNDPQGSGSTAVDGFALVNCHRALIDHCLIDHIQGDGIDSKSFDVAVVNSRIQGTGRNAVKFWRNGELINTIIYEADADAALVIDKGPCRMVHSVLMKKGDGYAGTFAYDESSEGKFEIINSVFGDLDHTFYVGTPDLRCHNCLFFDMPAGLFSGHTDIPTVTALNALSAAGGNIGADPLFIDPEKELFAPGAASPLRDAGAVSGFLLPAFDYFGAERLRGGAPDIGAIEMTPPFLSSAGDYDGDGTDDFAIFRPSTGLWAIRGLTRFYFGRNGDLPLAGDYDGDSTTESGIFRFDSGLWAIRSMTRFYFGSPSDLPVPADYDSDSACEAAIFRKESGLWAVKETTRVYYGENFDYPVPADYSGDGSAGIAIFRGRLGLWAIRGLTRLYFGDGTDTPIAGDYDGSGLECPAVFRPSSGLWAIRGGSRFYLGMSSDWPLPADFDGDGKDESGIFRPSSGLWAVRRLTRFYYGTSGDVPVTR